MLTSACCRALTLAALVAAAWARNPLNSRCLSLDSDNVCQLAPIGLEDRWFTPNASIRLYFRVGCGYTLGSDGNAYLAMHDISTEHSKTKPLYGMENVDTAYTGPFLIRDSDWVSVGAPEPGTQLFNVTLIDARTNLVVDSIIVCLEVTPPSAAYAKPAPIIDPDPTVPISGRPYRPSVAIPFTGRASNDGGVVPESLSPVRVMYLGDMGKFDGMKRFLYSNMRYLPKELVQSSFFDLTGGGVGVMGNLLIQAGVTIYKHSVTCPASLCSCAADFYDFVTNLTHVDTLEQLPQQWQEVFKPVVDVFKDFDAVVMVNDVHTDYYVAELARLANPRMLRIADLTTRFRLHHESTGYRNPPPFDALFSPSHFVGRHPAVVAEYKATYVTRGAVDAAEFDPDAVRPAPFCASRNWGPAGDRGSVVFGFIARLSLEKGPGLFLAAAQIVLRTIPDALFLMVGRPSVLEYQLGILRLAEAYGVADRLKIESFVEPKAVPSVYACMDVLVSPYIRPATETFGLANIEAMAMRVPFIHFGTGGIQDYAIDYVNSIRATDRTPEALAVAMLTLGKNPELRASMGVTARQDVLDHYSTYTVFRDNAAIFRRLVAAKIVDAFMDMALVTRVWEQAEVDECDPHVITNPLFASEGLYQLVCAPELVSPGPLLDGLAVSNAPANVNALDALFLECVVTLHPTAAPLGMTDVFGRDGITMRQNAVSLFLERHSRRSVLCVTVWSEAGGAAHELCSHTLGSTILYDSKWDTPPWASSLPPEAALNALMWPRLRLRLLIDPALFNTNSTAGVPPLHASAWIRDRDDPSLVYSHV